MPLTSGGVNRRIVLAAAALVAALGLASCADGSSNELTSNKIAASVEGVELSQDDLAAILSSDLGTELLQASPIDGFIDATSARGLISAWVGINSMIAAGVGADLDRAEIESSLAQQFAEVWDSAPAPMRDLAIANVVVGEAVQTGAVTTEELQAIVSAADVTVDSRYGWWSGEQFSVLPFG
jgi:hypothetical protein